MLDTLAMAMLRLLVFAAVAASQDASLQIIDATTIPMFSRGCTDALTANLTCNYMEIGGALYELTENYTTEFLDQLCTSGCAASIADYRSSVLEACSDDVYNDTANSTQYGPALGSAGGVYSPIVLPDYYFTNYQQRCLKDSSGEYCYIHLLDTDSQDPCDECGLKMFQSELENGYFYNDELASEFSSLTSSCGTSTLSTGMPSSVVVTSPAARPSTPSCSGRTVSIPAGSSCDSVAASQNISTWELLSTNGLDGSCKDFPTSGSLCISGSCQTYNVSQNDSCLGIANEFLITITQLQTWNPNLNRDCSNFDVVVGHQICVSNPHNFTLPTNTRALSTTAPTVEAAIPTDVVEGTNTHCGQYYKVTEGDTCAHITIMKAISLDDFYFLNPEVNENCTNLFLDYSYCVQPVGTISTYPGYAAQTATSGSATNTNAISMGTVTGSATPFDSLPDATIATLSSSPTPSSSYPRANGTRGDCDEYQDNVYGTVSCAYLQEGVPVLDFVYWNPSLSPYNCVLTNETQYCTLLGRGYLTASGNLSAPVDRPQNAAENSTSDCWDWYTLQDGDGCESIDYTFNITFKEFYTWNPSIGSQCSFLQPNQAYCVIGPSLTVDPNAPPAPTQSGIVDNCAGYYVAESGDSCKGIADQYDITLSLFQEWNPAVKSDCSGLYAGYAYCIDVPGSGETATPTPSPTQTCSTAPGPTQTGIPCQCDKFLQQTDGKYCGDLAAAGGITLDQFYSLNPAVGDSCQYLIAGDWYCVSSPSLGSGTGSSSPTTTSSASQTCATAPGPTQTGIPCNCSKFVQQTDGKYCGDLASDAGITLQRFYDLNPAVGDSCQYLVGGDWYCVDA